MIQMICGATRVGGRLVTPADGPFHTEAAVERRLIAKGVARAAQPVQAPIAAETVTQDTRNNEDAETEPVDTTANLDAEQLRQLPLNKLRALAKDMEIDTVGLKSKADFVEAITEADIDTEVIPAMDAADSIVL